MRIAGCIALWGDFSAERLHISEIGEDFNWPARPVSGPQELKSLFREFGVVAVLVHPATLGMPWREALKAITDLAPGVRVAVCHSVDQADSCEEMTAAGAFSTLLLPLVRTEVRHFLGFVWASMPENRAGSGNYDRVPAAKRSQSVALHPSLSRLVTPA